jgi:hypothetical protein
LAGITNPSIWNKNSEGTFGGPITKDRIWFFSSGRYETTSQTLTFVNSSQSALRNDINKRGEIKMTATPAMGHTISGDYTNNSTAQNNRQRARSGAAQQSSVLGQPVVHRLDEEDRHARHQGRRRVVPLAAHRRQLAERHELRLPDRLRADGRPAGARRAGCADSGLDAGREPRAELAAQHRRRHQHQHLVRVSTGSLDRVAEHQR